MAVMRIYGGLGYHLLKEDLNALHSGNTTIRVALLSSGYSFSHDHSNWGHVSGYQISSTTYPDYDAGGQEITGKEVDYESASAESTFKSTASKVTFTSDGNIAASFAVIYDDTPVIDSNKKLIACVDFEGEEESVDGKYELIWHGDGILRLGVA